MLIFKNAMGETVLIIYDENVKLASIEPVGDQHEPCSRITYVTEKGRPVTILCPLRMDDVTGQIPQDSLPENVS